MQELRVDKLHELEKEGVAGDEADVEGERIVVLFDRDNPRIFNDQVRRVLLLRDVLALVLPQVVLLVEQLIVTDFLVSFSLVSVVAVG